MKAKVSIKAVRNANDKMNQRKVYPAKASGITVSVNTGRLNKSYSISEDKINSAYKIARSSK